MPAADKDLLASRLRPVNLEIKRVLEKAFEPIEFVYFPENGIASVAGAAKPDQQIEIGMIGREGMTGLKVVLGDDRSPYETFVQAEGQALQIGSDSLRLAMKQSETMRDIMLRYVQVFMVQTAQTVLANAIALLPQKLARWLLMMEDRLSNKQLPLTHELLAVMIGAQRPGVTLALGELEDRGFIHARRGLITILDRAALIDMAKGLYGPAEKEYQRCLSPLGQARTV
jgi:CRP-like cAMP-binding protein